jgi:hypothetical protein
MGLWDLAQVAWSPIRHIGHWLLRRLPLRVVRIRKSDLNFEFFRQVRQPMREIRLEEREIVSLDTHWLELVFRDHFKGRRRGSNFIAATVRAHFFESPFSGQELHRETCAQWSTDSTRVSPLPNEDFSATVAVWHKPDKHFYPLTTTVRKSARDRAVELSASRYFLCLQIDALNHLTNEFWFWVRFSDNGLSATKLFSRPSPGMDSTMQP